MTPGGSPANDEGRVARRVVVHGRVQGVGFRASCIRRAAQAGVDGWVSNKRDGSVEVVILGPEPAVGQMVTWCAQGPPGARVERVDVTELEPDATRGFEVR